MNTIEWIRDHNGRERGYDVWASQHSDKSTTKLVASCDSGEFLLWLAVNLGTPQERIEKVVRERWLRAIRFYASEELSNFVTRHKALRPDSDVSVLLNHARKLGGVPDGIDLRDAIRLLTDAEVDLRLAMQRDNHRDRSLVELFNHVRSAVIQAAPGGDPSRAVSSVAAAARLSDNPESYEKQSCARDVRESLPELAVAWQHALDKHLVLKSDRDSAAKALGPQIESLPPEARWFEA